MKIAGLTIKAERTAYPAFAILAGLPIVARGGYALLRRETLRGRALLALPALGVGIAAFHALGQFVHQLGHALAARSVGYPMSGMRYEYAFAYSEYPQDEPPLPDSVHIRRSFGGVAGTAVVLTSAIVLWLRRGAGEGWLARWLRGGFLLDAALLFFASAVLSDGVLFIREEAWKAEQGEQ
jgi:hypothetical protein